MPCTDGGPDYGEVELSRLRGFTREAFGSVNPRADNNVLTRTLCEWASTHPDSVSRASLELQIWWRDHQRWDQKREADADAAQERARLREAGLAKLTSAERQALKV